MNGSNSNDGSNDGSTTEQGRHLLPQHIRFSKLRGRPKRFPIRRRIRRLV
jgi:hypothetical protein